jgi:iron complex transport system substrate-binding protein
MKKRFLTVLASLALCAAIISGCASTSTQSSSSGQPAADPSSSAPESAERTIVDMAGNAVTIPAAKDIQKVIITAPPYLSFYLVAVQKPELLVGVNSKAFGMANKELLASMMPNKDSVNTSFLNGFASNTEDVLRMDPDVIFIYGKSQREGLENIDIPVIDLCNAEGSFNEKNSITIDAVYREVFDIPADHSLENAWKKAHGVVDPILEKHAAEAKQKGLVIMSNTGSEMTVRGIGSFGDDWLKISGLENAAAMDGDGLAVSMENIYQMNPDIIYVMAGKTATEYLNGTIEGQDWSHTTAFQSGRIYDIPFSLSKWHAPSPDSPLTLEWMVSKNYPDDLTEAQFASNMKEYYQEHYGIELTDELMNQILHPYEK